MVLHNHASIWEWKCGWSGVRSWLFLTPQLKLHFYGELKNIRMKIPRVCLPFIASDCVFLFFFLQAKQELILQNWQIVVPTDKVGQFITNFEERLWHKFICEKVVPFSSRSLTANLHR